MLLSTVVPVYNTARYLRATLDSLLNQGLEPGEWEMILVDDGSTDGSGQICADYASAHPDVIRVISQSNRGNSAARNRGLEEARGEYVHFMDSDDLLAPDTYRFLSDFAGEEADYIGFNLTIVREGEMYEFNPDTGHPERMSGREVLASRRGTSYSTTGLFRRSYLHGAGLRFEEGITIWEDQPLMLRFFASGARCVLTGATRYLYILHPGSATQSTAGKRGGAWIAGARGALREINSLRHTYPELEGVMKGLADAAVVTLLCSLIKNPVEGRRFREVAARLRADGNLPVGGRGTLRRMTNLIMAHPWLYGWASRLYRLSGAARR